MKTEHMHNARRRKNDEYFTRRRDINAELVHYRDSFNGASVYCNCDDPAHSAFWAFFAEHMKEWHIRRITATYLAPDGGQAYAWTLEPGQQTPRRRPIGDGDFASPACQTLMRECDIVVTNPPFSIFRKYLRQVVGSGKRFLVLAPIISTAYNTVFPLIRDGAVRTGINSGSVRFTYGDGTEANRQVPVCWLTNMEPDVKRAPLSLTAVYKGNEAHYPRYANFNAINVDRLADIPADYDGVMGVPITILTNHCPAQFELIDTVRSGSPYADPRFINIKMHAGDGRRTRSGNYGHGAFLPIAEKPGDGRAYYELDGKLYRITFMRVLVRARKEGAV